MGLNLSDLGPVYIVCGKTDLRKGIDSLAYLIQSQFALDPFSKSVFLFCGGKSDEKKLSSIVPTLQRSNSSFLVRCLQCCVPVLGIARGTMGCFFMKNPPIFCLNTV